MCYTMASYTVKEMQNNFDKLPSDILVKVYSKFYTEE